MANVMIQGTMSSAGKSIICAALCRIFKDDGYRVCPFKSQNMSSKYYITNEGHKISIAQALQAKAAGIEPDFRINPILLRPNSNIGSDVILKGELYKSMDAMEYFEFKDSLRPMIIDVFKELEKDYDVVVLEGAGSPAEINLKQNDIVNMGMAEIADAPVLLVGDIDRGGVFASLYGTVMLLEERERDRIKGLIINKFRGDKRLLDSGINMIEELLNIPVVGTIPFIPLELEMENASENKIQGELDKLARMVRQNLDMECINSIMNLAWGM